jgi:hypothetical protein
MAQATLNRVLDDIKTLDPEELQMVEQAVRARLPESRHTGQHRTLTPQQIEAANELLRDTIVTLPQSMGVDNESIDADLAREYGDDHRALYSSAGSK